MLKSQIKNKLWMKKNYVLEKYLIRLENNENTILSKIAGYTPIPKFASHIELLVRIFP